MGKNDQVYFVCVAIKNKHWQEKFISVAFKLWSNQSPYIKFPYIQIDFVQNLGKQHTILPSYKSINFLKVREQFQPKARVWQTATLIIIVSFQNICQKE